MINLQSGQSGAFTSAHEAFWAASRRVNGDADGTRELIDVLLLHRSMDAGDIQAGITAALGVGAVSADVVAVAARRHATASTWCGPESARHPGALAEVNVQRVVSLTQRRLMDLAVGVDQPRTDLDVQTDPVVLPTPRMALRASTPLSAGMGSPVSTGGLQWAPV
jgi:hypothetical protein